MSKSADLLARHAQLTDELAAFLRERGDILQQGITAHSHTWRSTSALNVTERRETCRDARAQFDSEVARIDGDIEAIRAELAHLELECRYAADD